MSRTISSVTSDKPVVREIIRRTRRVVIEITVKGEYLLTAEQEDATYLDGEVLSVSPAPSVVITDEEIKKNKEFSIVQAALVSAIDRKGEEQDASVLAAAATVAEEI